MRREPHVRFCERAAVKLRRATHLVILSRGHAVEAMTWTRAVMTKLGLSLNEGKTSIRDARKERFEFLGYSFGPHYWWKNGQRYLGASPSKKSVQRIKAKISALLVPGNKGSWPEVRDRLNRLLSGWSAYFSHGTRVPAYRAVDAHVYDRVRNFLCRRYNARRRSTSRFSFGDVFGELAVLHLMCTHNGRPPWVVR
jgi:RNA-directed DNA polymerase